MTTTITKNILYLVLVITNSVDSQETSMERPNCTYRCTLHRSITEPPHLPGRLPCESPTVHFSGLCGHPMSGVSTLTCAFFIQAHREEQSDLTPWTLESTAGVWTPQVPNRGVLNNIQYTIHFRIFISVQSSLSQVISLPTLTLLHSAHAHFPRPEGYKSSTLHISCPKLPRFCKSRICSLQFPESSESSARTLIIHRSRQVHLENWVLHQQYIYNLRRIASGILGCKCPWGEVITQSEAVYSLLFQAMAGEGVKLSRRQLAAEGPATVMAIGTAVPPFVHEQSTYADYYFDVTNCNHKTELKAKFKRICESQHHNIHRPHVQYACHVNNAVSHRVSHQRIPATTQYTVQGLGMFNDSIQGIDRLWVIRCSSWYLQVQNSSLWTTGRWLIEFLGEFTQPGWTRCGSLIFSGCS